MKKVLQPRGQVQIQNQKEVLSFQPWCYLLTGQMYVCCTLKQFNYSLNLLHSELPKPFGVFAILSALWFKRVLFRTYGNLNALSIAKFEYIFTGSTYSQGVTLLFFIFAVVPNWVPFETE